MVEALVSWLGGEAKTVALAILSGVVAFLAKGAYELSLTRRKAEPSYGSINSPSRGKSTAI